MVFCGADFYTGSRYDAIQSGKFWFGMGKEDKTPYCGGVKMIALVFCGDLRYCPYISRYIERLERLKRTTGIFWNRSKFTLNLSDKYVYFDQGSDMSSGKVQNFLTLSSSENGWLLSLRVISWEGYSPFRPWQGFFLVAFYTSKRVTMYLILGITVMNILPHSIGLKRRL